MFTLAGKCAAGRKEFPYVASTAGGAVNTGTSHTIDLPSGIEAGDLIIVAVNGTGTSTPVFPSPWVSMYQYTSDGYRYRIASGGETAVTYTTSSSVGGNYVAYCIKRWGGTAADIAYTGFRTDSTNAPNPSSLASGFAAGSKVLWIVAFSIDGTTLLTAFPANYTLYPVESAVSGRHVTMACRELAATTEDPGAGTMNGTTGASVGTFAVRGP